MSKPIDLIVANTMHDVVEALRLAEGFVKAVKGKPYTVEMSAAHCEHVARHLLCQIAHNAPKKNVFMALKLLGAPYSDDDITESVRAVMEGTE